MQRFRKRHLVRAMTSLGQCPLHWVSARMMIPPKRDRRRPDPALSERYRYRHALDLPHRLEETGKPSYLSGVFGSAVSSSQCFFHFSNFQLTVINMPNAKFMTLALAFCVSCSQQVCGPKAIFPRSLTEADRPVGRSSEPHIKIC